MTWDLYSYNIGVCVRTRARARVRARVCLCVCACTRIAYVQHLSTVQNNTLTNVNHVTVKSKQNILNFCHVCECIRYKNRPMIAKKTNQFDRSDDQTVSNQKKLLVTGNRAQNFVV